MSLLGNSNCRLTPDKANPIYVYIYLKINEAYVKNFANGSVTKTITKEAVRNLDIRLPERLIQDEIVKIYSSLSGKIELNRQINQTLEQMAQAIFKSWFVDFDPVRAKMEGHDTGLPAHIADLFPDELEESEVGLKPKGWVLSTFGDVAACYDSKRIPLSNRERVSKKGNIPYYGATSVMDYVDNFLFDDIFLLMGEDGSVLKEDGTPFLQYIWGKSWVNNHAHVLQGKNGVSTEHLMIFLKNQNIAAYVTGAVQLKLNQKNMNSIPFLKAKNEINQAFDSLIKPFYNEYRQKSEEISFLIQTRDALLPKLLAGEIPLGEGN